MARIDALAGLQVLAWLSLERNPVSDLAPLQGFPHLRWVWADDEASHASIALPLRCCIKAIDPDYPPR